MSVENDRKIRQQPDRKNAFAGANGGSGVRHIGQLSIYFYYISENLFPQKNPQTLQDALGICRKKRLQSASFGLTANIKKICQARPSLS
jgi:hypothetical protein